MKHIIVFSFLIVVFLFTSSSISVSALPPGWEDDARITSEPSFSGFPKLVLDSQGNIHSTWQENRDGNAEVYYKKLNNTGSSLTSDIRLTSDRFISFYPSISRDQSGNIHIVWLDDRDGNSEIYYKKLDNNGNPLVADTRLTTDLAVSWFPAVSTDSSGGVHVAWVDNRDSNLEIYYTKLNNNGATVVDDTRLTTDPADSTLPAISSDDYSMIHLLWKDSRDANEEVYYKRSLRPKIIVQGSPNIGQTINLQLSNQFNPNIQYILVMALSSVPGMPLGDGRIIPVNPDILLMTSLQYPNSIGLSNNIGIINPQGRAQASWAIPSVTELAGVTVYFAYITLDSSLPFPQSITSISNTVPVTLLP